MKILFIFKTVTTQNGYEPSKISRYLIICILEDRETVLSFATILIEYLYLNNKFVGRLGKLYKSGYFVKLRNQ